MSNKEKIIFIHTMDHGECIVLVIDAGNRGEIYNHY